MAEPRSAVVTGGGRGIGSAVALRLAADGLRVHAVGRHAAALDGLRRTAADRGLTVTTGACDVTSEEAVAQAFGEVDPVDVLVNNAGVAGSARLGRTTLEEWSHHLAVNATGAFLCTRAVFPGMVERGWGRVVNIASVAALTGAPYIAAYAASKHALLGLTRVTAAEAAGTGVTANAVCPGYTRSDMTEQTIARVMERTGRTRADAQQALGPLLEPEQVAATVAFLVSDGAGAVNGETVVLQASGTP